MNSWIDLAGKMIDLEHITTYQIIRTNYVFRPAFTETKRPLIGRKYVFSHAIPYGVIVDRQGHISAIEQAKAANVGEAVFQEIANGVVGALSNIFNWNNINRKVLTLIDTSGRPFKARLDEIPAQIETCEGQRIDVFKGDELYNRIGANIAPEIRIVEALVISFKDNTKTAIFGSGIDTWDVRTVYEGLKKAHTQMISLSQPAQKGIQLPNLALPNIHFPAIQLPFRQTKKAPEEEEER